jgi:hypothetical protein
MFKKGLYGSLQVSLQRTIRNAHIILVGNSHRKRLWHIQENKFVGLFNAALATVQTIESRENNVKIYLREFS